MSELAIDIGSEFVDVALRQAGQLRVSKIPAAGRTDSEAILQALDVAVQDWALAIPEIAQLRIGSTGAVNAVLARRGAKVGLITTQGFADTLYLGRQNRAELYEPVARSAAPSYLVERANVVEIAGRLDAQGREITPLDSAAIAGAAALFAERGIEAVAICLLFAHTNPRHEQHCAEQLAALLPGIDICLSSTVDANAREYERTVSVCLEAWLRPATARTLRSVEAGLAERGFAGKLAFAEARGALVDAATASGRVINLMTSGPAVSAGAASAIATAMAAPQALCVDIGSTSTDIALIQHGEPACTTSAVFAGIPLRLAMSDVESLALGGTSRAVRQATGTFGFDVAAASDAPTLSDALAQRCRVAGLDPAGGPDRLAQLAGTLGLGIDAVAQQLIEAAEHRAATALLRHAVRRNLNPDTMPLVAMGGLGGLFAIGIAERLGINRIALPAAPAAGGALGLLLARALSEAEISINAEPGALDDAALRRLAEQLLATARLSVSDGAPSLCQFSARMAANPHMHAITVPLGAELPTASALSEAFAAQHRRQYAMDPPGPGFVFTLGARLLPVTAGDAAALPVPADWVAGPVAASGLIETAAGVILRRPGWGLEAQQAGYWLLTRERNDDR